MDNKILKKNENMNYQFILDKILVDVEKKNELHKVPQTLLLHSCCAPCSSYVLEYLNQYFSITIYYYNPNISELIEYKKRVEEQKKLISLLPAKYEISFLEGQYEVSEFYQAIQGLEHLGERSERCYACYRLRLEQAAKIAKENGFNYFATTLSISPYKNAKWLNEIGGNLQSVYDVNYLFSDFKKKNGYKRSIELSEQYDLYRQDFCGCIYSKVEEKNRKNNKLNCSTSLDCDKMKQIENYK